MVFILSILFFVFSTVIEPDERDYILIGDVEMKQISSWIPVAMSVITPIGFASNAVLMRLMVIDLNFDTETT